MDRFPLWPRLEPLLFKHFKLSLGDFFFLFAFHPAICFPPDGCLNNGHCVSPGICSCARGWTGAKCQTGMIACYSIAMRICSTNSPYWQHGGLDELDLHYKKPVTNLADCLINSFFYAQIDLTAWCTAVFIISFSTAVCIPSCRNHGRCIHPNVCFCASGWGGRICDTGIYIQAFPQIITSFAHLQIAYEKTTEGTLTFILTSTVDTLYIPL